MTCHVPFVVISLYAANSSVAIMRKTGVNGFGVE